MITWMQKNKKWLVVTIWISTIAFVGAGFVGWGSYTPGSSSGSVAVVGDREVSVEEYQREYSALYQQYQQVFGDQFNQEVAQNMNLHETAINLIIQKNLIMSYGDDLGILVTDEDVAKELVQIPAFIKDGKFDKQQYLTILAQNRTTAVEFEEALKRDILLKKVENLFELKPTSNEVNNLAKLLYLQNEVSIKLLNPENIKVEVTDEKLKEYWEINKIKYMSLNSYELEISNIALNKISPSNEELQKHYADFKSDYTKEDGKIKSFDEAKEDMILTLSKKETKRAALKDYLVLKKGESSFDSKVVYFENELPFVRDDITKIIASAEGTVLKPFETTEGFAVVKLLKKIDPQPLSFEEAKPRVEFDYVEIEKSKQLNELAKAELENFKGTDLGFIGRSDYKKVTGLSEEEAIGFINQLFTVSVKKGQLNIGNKVVLYNITDSKLGTLEESKTDIVKSTLLRLQTAELMDSLVKNLENRFEVYSSLDVEE